MPASSSAGSTSSAKARGVPLLQLVRLLGDVGEHVRRGAADVRRHREPGEDAALQAGDAHHEELVEVAGEDGEEVGALEHRQRRVFGELEHALVERQPAQLAVEVAVFGQARIVGSYTNGRSRRRSRRRAPSSRRMFSPSIPPSWHRCAAVVPRTVNAVENARVGIDPAPVLHVDRVLGEPERAVEAHRGRVVGLDVERGRRRSRAPRSRARPAASRARPSPRPACGGSTPST